MLRGSIVVCNTSVFIPGIQIKDIRYTKYIKYMRFLKSYDSRILTSTVTYALILWQYANPQLILQVRFLNSLNSKKKILGFFLGPDRLELIIFDIISKKICNLPCRL